jgi:hypothetical protein
MNAFSRSKIILPLVSALAVFALSAHAEEPAQQPTGGGAAHGSKPSSPAGAAHAVKPVPGHPPGPVAGRGPQDAHRGPPDARFAHGALPARNFGGHPYRGHLAWEGGRWHHEVHDGRDGWWWDVGGVWYYYPQPMEGPPTYISEDYADDVGGPYGPPVADGYAPPPPGAYAPPPPEPAPDPAASAVGGAIVGGLLGGLLTGHASGAAAGAIAGGATGAIVGAQAASRPGYYLAQGNCYYRYPSGQYVQADPRACY